jgi:hypothetical protein
MIDMNVINKILQENKSLQVIGHYHSYRESSL